MFGFTPKTTSPSTCMPSGVFCRLRRVRISSPPPTSSTRHSAICRATMILPVRDLPASALDVAAEVFSASSAPPASATRSGASPNSSAATTSTPSVNSKTVLSGARLDSICAQLPSSRVAISAKPQASAPPAETRIKLSASSCRSNSPRPAPSAWRTENSRCRAAFRAINSITTLVMRNQQHQPYHRHQDA